MERIAVVLVVLATLRGTCAVSSTDKQVIVDKHNEFRGQACPAAANMLKIRWNDKLATSAQNFVNNCPDDHDDNAARAAATNLNVSVGQNMAFGQDSWDAAVTSWHSEITNFSYGEGGGPTEKTVGNFTQMMLSRSSHVGCGYKECPDKAYLKRYVCNYAFRQSSNDEKTPWTSGPSCSQCGGTCSGNVCDCGDKLCANGGTLDTFTCSCKCPRIYSGTTCNQKNCKPDPDHCGKPQPIGFEEFHCTQWTNVPDECPNMCGLC